LDALFYYFFYLEIYKQADIQKCEILSRHFESVVHFRDSYFLLMNVIIRDLVEAPEIAIVPLEAVAAILCHFQDLVSSDKIYFISPMSILR